VIRYIFNVGLLHPLLLAGLPGALPIFVILHFRHPPFSSTASFFVISALTRRRTGRLRLATASGLHFCSALAFDIFSADAA